MSINTDFYTEDEIKSLGLAKCGKNVLISKQAKLVSPEQLKLGDHVRIDDHCILVGDISIGSYVHVGAFTLLSGINGIEINDFCSISARNTFYSAIDDYSGEYLVNPMLPDEYKNAIRGRIEMGKHVALGAGVTVLPNVTIGEGAVVGAHSLVVVPLNPWNVYFGSPAKFLKKRSTHLLNLEKKFLNSSVVV